MYIGKDNTTNSYFRGTLDEVSISFFFFFFFFLFLFKSNKNTEELNIYPDKAK